MNTIKLNRNSWHYRLYECYANNYLEPNDICVYTQNVILGAITVFFIMLVAIVASIAVGDFLLWSYFNLFVGSVDMEKPAAIFLIFSASAVIIFGIGTFRDYSKFHDNFVTSAYRSHKDKYCVKVEVEGKKDKNVYF
jgi:hypothetical protein